MVLRFIIVFFLLSNAVFGQKNVCLLSSKPENKDTEKLLIEKSKAFNIKFLEANNLENLSNCGAVFFLDFDESKLSVKENAMLVSFF